MSDRYLEKRHWGDGAWAMLVAGALGWGCGGGDGGGKPGSTPVARAAPRAPELGAIGVGGGAAQVAGALPQNPEFYAWQHCDRVGRTAIERLGTMYQIAISYDGARARDCRTAGLVTGLDDSQTSAWWDYLTNYTIALAGCPLVVERLSGGISVFGPANTRSIGILPAAIGRDDVALLIEMYLEPFAVAFALPEQEKDALQSYLWGTAASEIDASVSGGLSMCGESSAE